jgi:hypothetical protein
MLVQQQPLPIEIEECRPRFVKELRDLSPKLIIAAGAIASEALLGTKRRPGQRGAVLWSDYWNAYILDTHHPSFALQSQSMNAVQDIIRDLSKIPLVLEWPPTCRAHEGPVQPGQLTRRSTGRTQLSPSPRLRYPLTSKHLTQTTRTSTPTATSCCASQCRTCAATKK